MATILVVDDEPDIRSLVQLNLELDGHRVLLAANGEEALKLVADEIPDVMLLDLMMPGIDGFEVLEAIKAAAEPDVSRIPVVMLTAYDTVDNRIRGGIEGALRYLRKPFSPSVLRDEVRAVLEGEPEPAQRRRVQQAALEQLARLEKGDVEPGPVRVARPHITRLEHRPAATSSVTDLTDVRARLADLTDKQRALLERLADTPSVSEAASDLGVSRSNVYASLRRITRKLGVDTVPDLLALVRDGTLLR